MGVSAYLAEGLPMVRETGSASTVSLLDPATGAVRTALTIPPYDGQRLLVALPGAWLGSLVTSDG